MLSHSLKNKSRLRHEPLCSGCCGWLSYLCQIAPVSGVRGWGVFCYQGVHHISSDPVWQGDSSCPVSTSPAVYPLPLPLCLSLRPAQLLDMSPNAYLLCWGKCQNCQIGFVCPDMHNIMGKCPSHTSLMSQHTCQMGEVSKSHRSPVPTYLPVRWGSVKVT